MTRVLTSSTSLIASQAPFASSPVDAVESALFVGASQRDVEYRVQSLGDTAELLT